MHGDTENAVLYQHWQARCQSRETRRRDGGKVVET